MKTAAARLAASLAMDVFQAERLAAALHPPPTGTPEQRRAARIQRAQAEAEAAVRLAKALAEAAELDARLASG